MSEKFELEICLDSVASCKAAAEGGADRVELCDNLFEGGTTPSLGTIEIARERISIELAVMIRPRGGDFLYSEDELQIMERDIDAAVERGADTVVFGLLTAGGRIDRQKTSRLLERVNGRCKVTFHRAFDVSCDLEESLSDLIDMGLDRVLTSGGEPSVLEGSEMLRKLVTQASGKIMVMAGCGINSRNFDRIRREVGAPAYHMTASSPVQSPMQYRNERCFMGKALFPPEFTLSQVDAAKVSWYRNRS
jgi:copper homeostasis protein